ncbi:MAG: membrane dipeptidase [Clostridia bacterium]|nr:membrane dipeptidase [Clostridia bacterium]
MQLFDLHCDTLYRAYTEKSTLFNDSFHISFNKTGEISPYIQCLAIWITDEYRGESAEKFFLGCVNKLEEQLENTDIKWCRNGDDIREIQSKKQKGIILTVESGAVLNGKIENISMLKKYGVKMMTLTWNGTNELGDGIGVENGGGLTDFGRKAVREMEKNNIIVDISHASERLFYDVAEISEKPFCASHSDSKKITPHKRNLTDEQFEIIKNSGGLVGLNFCRDFLNKRATNAEMYDIIRHAEHFLSLGGEKTLAIGGDFDGADIPHDMNGIESMPNLYELFLKQNYSQSLVDDIFFNNAADFFSKQA